MTKIRVLAAALACAAASLSACSTLGVGPGGISAGNTQQIVANIKAFNDFAAQGPCAGWGNLDWSPPLPPVGGLHVMCQVGNPQVMSLKQFSGAGGAFGGAGSSATAPPAIAPATTPPLIAPAAAPEAAAPK